MEGSLLGNAAATGMLLCFLLCGYVLVRALALDAPWGVQLWLGLALGLLLMMWLPALFAFFLGFGMAAHLCALAVAVAAALGGWWFRRPRLLPPGKEAFEGMHPAFFACVVPMTALAVYLLLHHTLRPEAGALYTGQSGYGDMSMHLGFVTSIARQGIFPPEYSILPGVALGYPFLCDSISSSLYLAGTSLRYAYILPAALAMALVFAGYYFVMEAWVGRRGAVFAYWLFFVGGGFGFAYFFDGAGADSFNFTRIFSEFYQTPTNLVEQNIRWVTPLADMILPQRATLFGWMLLLPCLYMLVRCHRGDGLGLRGALFAGLVAGGMPMVHTHSFLALGIFSVVFFARSLAMGKEERRGALSFLLPFGLIALALAAPQLFTWTFRQADASGFLRWHFNWANKGDPYLWFYIKNIGIVFVLLLPALLNADKQHRAFWLCAAPIWLIAEIAVFQPNEYDNNKLLFVVHMLSCGLVGDALSRVSRASFPAAVKGSLLAGVMLLGTLSGALTLARECVSNYALFTPAHVEAARFIDETLPKDAMILTGGNHNNAVAALTGRNVVYGTETYLYFHGVSDAGRRADRDAMLTDPQAFGYLFAEYGVTHVYCSSYERYEGANGDRFAQWPIVFERGDVTIYEIVPP